jgi:hypothetical protein
MNPDLPTISTAQAQANRRARRVAAQRSSDDRVRRSEGLKVPHRGPGPIMDLDDTGAALERPDVVVIEMGRSPLHAKVWGFTCPQCRMTFRRTSPAMAHSWAAEHLDRFCGG